MIKVYRTFSLVIESDRIIGYNFYVKKTFLGIPYKIINEDIPINEGISRILDEVCYYDEDDNLIIELESDNNDKNKVVGFKK